MRRRWKRVDGDGQTATVANVRKPMTPLALVTLRTVVTRLSNPVFELDFLWTRKAVFSSAAFYKLSIFGCFRYADMPARGRRRGCELAYNLAKQACG